jgi:hypothetical protein
MRTLWCEAGQHEWQRPAQRGRQPINCPDHFEVVTTNSDKIDGLEKARLARVSKKNQEEEIWAAKIESVINNPRMKPLTNDKYSTDARLHTPSKLRYIQNQLQNNRANRTPSDIADLERMREKIMSDPFNSSGHLY